MAENINESKFEGFKWSRKSTLLLISLIQENYDQLQTGVKKFAFQEIAKEINTRSGTNLTFDQIDSKWKGLKKTYKKIKDSNADTGQARKSWEFFNDVDKVLHYAPEINHPATLSTDDIELSGYDTDLEGGDNEVASCLISRKRSYSGHPGFKWSRKSTLLLISLIKENYNRLQTDVKKIAFQDIAKEINKRIETNLTFEQIDTKWKGLKRTYKKIRDSNADIGQSRSWEFFNDVDEILHYGPEINPLAILSTEHIEEISYDSDLDSGDNEEASCSNTRKRSYTGSEDMEDAKERRHKERMEVSKKFLTLFEKMIDKM